MEYLSPSRRLRIPKKKFTIEQERGKKPALSQSHRPPPPPTRELSFRLSPLPGTQRGELLS